jgi:hypothetical protein
MRFGKFILAALFIQALSLLALAPAANAQFLGTTAKGNLSFGSSGGTNYFNPSNGQVPVGPLNKKQGIMVTVADPATEFGFADARNTDSVNITADTITLTDVSVDGSNSFFINLTDSAFAGLTFNKVSDTFLNGGITYSLTGKVLFLSSSNGFISNGGTYTAVFKAVPEPGSVALLVGMGLSGAGFLARRKTIRKAV